jgi:hypothetical protein
MSSQAVNSTSYSGYTTASTGGNASNNNSKLGQVPLRDSSDATRQIREQILYREKRAGTPVQPGNSEQIWLTYGNQLRLSYLYGKLKCTKGACAGDALETANAFNANGAYSTVPGGATFGGS